MPKKRFCAAALVLCLVMIACAGCASATPKASPTHSPTHTPTHTPALTPTHTPELFPSESPLVSPEGSPHASPEGSPEVSPNGSPEGSPSPVAGISSRAQRISERTLEVAEVQAATVILMGNNCLIGLELSADAANRADAISRAEAKARLADPTIARCAVTAYGEDLISIRRLADSVETGASTRTQQSEFSSLIEKIALEY